MTKAKLLATSPTIEGITEMLNKYYYSEGYSVDPDTLRINHPTKDVNDEIQIVHKKGRYRLESKYDVK